MANAYGAAHEVKKRDGRLVSFDRNKIVTAIIKAAQAVHGSDRELAEALTSQVLERLERNGLGASPSVELIQDTIEKVLIENGHARTAKAFILYRARRSRIREGKSELMEAVADIVTPDEDEGPVPSLPLAIGLAASRQYCLNRVLPEAFAEAHQRGLFHIHGLSLFGQVPHSLVVGPEQCFRQGLRLGSLELPPVVGFQDAIEWLRHVMLQAREIGYAHTTFQHIDRALAGVADGVDDQVLQTAIDSLLLTANASATPGHVHLRFSGETGRSSQRVALACLNAWEKLRIQASGPIQPRLVLECAQAPDGACEHPVLLQGAQLAAQWGEIVFERALKPDAFSAYGLLSLNVARVALQARAEGEPFEHGLSNALKLAISLLHDQRHRLAAQAERNPLRFIDPCARPSVIALVGLQEAFTATLGSPDLDSEPARDAVFRILRSAQGVSQQAEASDGWCVVLSAQHPVNVAESFARRDRREFGILKGVTEASAYGLRLHQASEACEVPLTVLGAFEQWLEGGQTVHWPLEGASDPQAVLGRLGDVWRLGVHGATFARR